jgi:hypothetical protein
MFFSAAFAAVLTAFWAIQNRTLPVRAALYAFVLVGTLAGLALATLPPDNKQFTVAPVLRATVTIALYQTALFAAFSTGSKLTQAVVNLNVAVIVVIDAVTIRACPSLTVAAACILQIVGAALVHA